MGLCSKCSVKVIAYNRYYDSNIPIEYWNLSMENIITNAHKSQAFSELSKIYLNIINDLNKSYIDGIAICLTGNHGCGKTTSATNVLKKACQKNFTTLYTTLTDIVSVLTLSPSEDKFFSRKELIEVDFLVIDELDVRFFGASDNAADLFGRSFENVVRTRLQNKLPMIIISNSPNPNNIFIGSLKESLNSLLSKFNIIPILGEDYRKLK